MSVVRLLVLGVVRRQGTAHGYAVRRELLSWRAETWTNAKPGSIYHALKQLSAEGKLREAGTERSDEGPGRTLYELTAEGETEFMTLMDQALVSVDMEELGAAIAFMDALPRAQVIDRLREQQRNAATVREQLLAMIPEFPGRYEVPHSTDLLELWSGVFENLSGWTGRLLARLEAGEYTLAD